MDEADNTAETTPLVPIPERPERGPSLQMGQRLRHILWEVASTILPALAITLTVNVFVAQAMVVQGPSMQPNLDYRERVLVEKITYRLEHSPRRGDIVTLDLPGENGELIKRVVGLEGETVEVRAGRVFINGQLLEERWLTWGGGPDYGPYLVPPQHVFVLGDNRANSRDSRFFGPVPLQRIVARAVLVYWPLNRWKLL